MPPESMALDYQFVEIQGQRIRWGITPGSQGVRPLLLFNGIGAPMEAALPFIRTLRSTQVFTLDLPGVGQSPLPSSPYRIATLARLAAEVLDHAGVREVDVLGVSWGGSVAQQFVRDHPQRCRRLILVVTTAGIAMAPGSPASLVKMANPWRFFTPEGLSALAPPADGQVTETYIRRLTEFGQLLARGSKRSYLLQLLAISGWTSIHWLHRLQQPALVMMGEDDPLVPAVNGRILCRRLPNARLRLYRGGHLFMLTRPEPATEDIEAFLATTDPLPPEELP